MNRLILIGNGFDLAHGLKTGYNDFILWYLNQALQKTLTSNVYEDALFKVRFNSEASRHDASPQIIEQGLIKLYNADSLHNLILNQAFPTRSRYSNATSLFDVYGVSSLIDALLKCCGVNNWVDIENEYYKQLISIQGNKTRNANSPKVSALNDSMNCLISKLHQYLNTIPQPAKVDGYNAIFRDIIKVNDVHNPVDAPYEFQWDEAPQATLVLNFNYTSTIDLYNELNSSETHDLDVSYIHGTKDIANSMIFGFGDELDDRYSEFERETDKGYFKYMKSFWYLKTPKYRELIRFIDSGAYQVYVVGHSCGLSDRTMLNMVFEHKYCRSIKIFYHRKADGSNNYTDLTYDIARHFKNKGEMRMRVVDFESSEEMPQAAIANG